MRITCLIENTSRRSDICAEHGLSLYIESGGTRILFDTGADGAFAENAQKLGIDLGEVDFAVLSHGHYDHGGGLKTFLELNDHAPVYVNRNAFGRFVDTEKDRYIGLDQRLKENPRVICAGDILSLTPRAELRTFHEKKRPWPIMAGALAVQREGVTVPEQFDHEQYLLIREEGRIVLISGCSHRGILNVMSWCEPDVLVGGFHLFNLDMEKEGPDILEKTAEKLTEYKTVYYTGHCTGEAQYAFLKERMGDRLLYLASGDCIEV